MEAPVPASALIHSATLVSAGIFIILRLYPLFELSQFFIHAAPFIGVLTAFVGGFVAFFQSDLKKILAYSTISHCGFLVYLTTCSSAEIVLFYLYIHGFFKAIIFLCAGNIIRFNKNYQDIKRMGQFWKYLPFEFSVVFLCLLNLSGLPWFFGFYIKHSLLVINSIYTFSNIVYIILFAAALTGLGYSYRIIFYVFFDIKKARKSVYLMNSNDQFKSDYFSNSNIGGSLAIFFLLITSYIISIVYYFNLKNSLFIDSSELHFNKNEILMFLNYDINLGFNYSFLNWWVIIFSILLIFLRFNDRFNRYNLLENLYQLILCIIFFKLLSFEQFYFNFILLLVLISLYVYYYFDY